MAGGFLAVGGAGIATVLTDGLASPFLVGKYNNSYVFVINIENNRIDACSERKIILHLTCFSYLI